MPKDIRRPSVARVPADLNPVLSHELAEPPPAPAGPPSGAPKVQLENGGGPVLEGSGANLKSWLCGVNG
jgi:hypothetical protein